MKEFMLMIKVDNIKSENGFKILSQIENCLNELSEIGDLEGGIVEK